LLGHRRVVSLHLRRIERLAALAQDVENQVRRTAIGVVQLEQGLAIDASVLFEVRIEPVHARFQRLCERRLFRAQRLFDQRAFAGQFGIRLAHHLAQRLDHAPEQAVAAQCAKFPDMTDRAPDDPPEHVTASFIGRQHTIDDQETACADVIGNHAQ